MLTVTRFCVQPYLLAGASLVPGEVMHFHFEDDARRAAEVMLKRVYGVEIYFVMGEPVIDLWRKPVLLEVLGGARTSACSPQPSVPVPWSSASSAA